ncbi:uncharacterized protein LOC142575186 isoform X4 [Dermacentor variabilis]|uniref:uncharacterized protein LOC142575186 isoform X4 n=1 Tax=Dermacentor variabilis TaxID=34621 RepID=UPI003F5C8DEF
MCDVDGRGRSTMPPPSAAMMAWCVVLLHFCVATGIEENACKDICDIQAAYDENVNDLKVDAMVKLLGCMRHTANYDDSLLRLFFADDFMGELKTAERKCQKELL